MVIPLRLVGMGFYAIYTLLLRGWIHFFRGGVELGSGTLRDVYSRVHIYDAQG